MVLPPIYIVSETKKKKGFLIRYFNVKNYLFSTGFLEPIISLPLQYTIMTTSEVFNDQTQEGRNFSNYYNYYFNSIILLLLFLKQKIFILLLNFF